MRQAAQLYTNLRWVIHPIRPPETGNKHTGKAPFESSWQHRTKPRTPEELDKFFRGTGYNIGLLCGKASGITVIDIDDINFLQELTKGIDTGSWVISARNNEPGRGHLFFKYVADLPAQKHHIVGIEVLNDGNNCVLPPSRHYSGGTYAWRPDGPGPDQVPEMPEKFKERLLNLFKTEKKLKGLLSKARPCFRSFIETPEKLHGGDGRRFMLALATELAASADELNYGSQEKATCLKMAAKLVYREDYDAARTEKELGNVDPKKTWKCSTLSLNFPNLCDCQQCKFTQREAAKPSQDAAGFPDLLLLAENLQKQAPIHYDKAGAYWLWADTGFKMVDETDLLIIAKNILKIRGLTVQRVKAEFLEGIRITGRERQVNPKDPAWIQFKDRVINFRTEETFSPSPDYFFTSPIPHNLGDSEETPQIDKLFEEWVGTGRKRILYEILAYALIDDYPIHRVFCLIGTGRNGKGQFMKLLRRFIGINNITSTELERIEESRFETAKLYQKRVVFIGETNFSAINKTNRLKQLSGGDIVTGEWKRKSPFDFMNTAKIVIGTNSLPVTHDRTDGFYSRWLVIAFPNRFNEGKDVVDPIPETEFENLGRKSLRILRELLEAGGFYGEGSIEDRARAYEDMSNPVAAFIKEYCEVDQTASTPLYELFDLFEHFQVTRGYRQINKKQFSLQLQEMGYDKEKGKIADFYGYFIQGLKLRKPGPGHQLVFNTEEGPQDGQSPAETSQDPDKLPQVSNPEATERPQEGKTAPPLYQPIPGQEIPDSALMENPDLDREIIESVRNYTGGTMYVKNLQMFIDHFFRKHPYATDKMSVGGRIRILHDHGWRPR